MSHSLMKIFILALIVSLGFTFHINQSLFLDPFKLAPQSLAEQRPAKHLISDSRHFYSNTRHGPIPVYLELGEHAFKMGLTDELIETLMEILTWKNGITELKEKFGVEIWGRSIVLPLPKGNSLKHELWPFKAIKLKAITDHGQLPNMEPYHSSGQKGTFRQPTVNLIIRSGRLTTIKSNNKPTGTGFLTHAINEYRTMSRAFNEGVLTGLPIGVGQFLNWTFENKPVGFVLIALEDFPDKRLGSHFDQEILALNKKDFIDRLSALPEITKRAAELISLASLALRDLHSAGMILKNPHLQNFGLLSTGQVLLYDFENTISYKNLTRDEFIFWVFHDLSCFYSNVKVQFDSGLVLDNLISSYLSLLPSQTVKSLNRIATPLLVQETALSNLEFKKLESLFQRWRKNPVFQLIEDWAGKTYDQLTYQQNLTAWTDEIDSSV